MKIHQLLTGTPIILTNEEKQFVNRHSSEIPLHQLMDRDQVLARNLVRKGIYDISKDNRHLLLKPESNSEYNK